MFDTPFKIFTQIVGFCGTVCNALSFQQNKRSRILIIQLIGSCFFVTHFIMLGEYTGAALNLISFFRSIVFVNSGKKWAKSRIWFCAFIAANIIGSIVTWSSPFSALPAVAMSLTTIANWMKSEKKIRLITFPSSPCWLAYNIYAGSVAGIVTEIITMTSIITSIVRYDILHKGDNKNDSKGNL